MKPFDRPALIVLLIALGLLSLAGAFMWLRIANPSDGARLQPGELVWQPDGAVVMPLVESSSALRPGDVVTAVDGVSLEVWATALADFRRPRPEWRLGEAVTYTVRRGGQRLDVAIPLEPYPLGSVMAQNWGATLFALVNMAVASFVFFKRPAERAARVLFLGAASMLSATTWSFGLTIDNLVGGTGFWLFKATTFGAYMLVWITALHMALVFPAPRLVVVKHRWIIPALYAAPYAIHAMYVPAARAGTASTLDWLSRADRDVGLVQLVYLSLTMVAAVVGYRAARDPISRQQVRWVLYAFVVVFALAIVFAMLPEVILGYPLLSWNVVALSGLLVPIAITIAILRYHLFDIDVIINRTLVYGALTAIVASLYVFVVGYLGNWLHEHSRGSHTLLDLTVSLVATGIVAVIFQPLRERLQRAVNRLMYGERDDPYAVLSRLGQRLEATLAPEAVLPTIVETVAQALKLSCVAIALKDANTDEFKIVAASSPNVFLSHPATAGSRDRGAAGESLPLVYQGEVIGLLIFSPRGPGESFTAAERRLLADIAHQAGVAADAVRLTAALQRSREQLVTAREEERRRLRRDLHDGLGPKLAGQTLKLEAAHDALDAEPQFSRALLEELIAESQTLVAEIRRLVYALRPPVLDDLGLVAAVRQQAAECELSGLRVTVTAPPALPLLPAAVEAAAYRIIQEACTNVVRHAHARHCWVQLALTDSALCVEVADDGVGLPAGRRAGVGLVSLRERAEEIGGVCLVEARTDGGTRVMASLPLPKE